MIENFNEGQNSFNNLRKEFSLPEIPIRDHNFFFNYNQTLNFMKNFFDVIYDINISSTYYLVSRIIYSSICKVKGEVADYSDIHHELASKLPFLGNFGPTRAIIFKKK